MDNSTVTVWTQLQLCYASFEDYFYDEIVPVLLHGVDLFLHYIMKIQPHQYDYDVEAEGSDTEQLEAFDFIENENYQSLFDRL